MIAVALLLAAAAVVVAPVPAAGSWRLRSLRLRALRSRGPGGTAAPEGPAPARPASGRVALAVPSVVAVAGVAALAGGTTVLVVTAVAAGGWWWSRRSAASGRQRRERARRRRDLPDALELLGGCLVAGVAPVAALQATGEAIGGSLGDDLGRVARAFRFGASASEAWHPYLDDPQLAALARAALRSAERGTPLARGCQRIAEEARAATRVAGEVAVRRVEAAAVIPLGLCYLPAFICLAVAPVVIGVAGEIPIWSGTVR